MVEKRSYALLIGVGKRPEDAPGMAVSADDAKNIALAMTQYCRIPDDQLTTLTSEKATRENIFSALEDLAEKTSLEEADTVVIYFSGHGCRVQNDLYLVSHDSQNSDIPGTAIAGNQWINLLKKCKASKMLVILDCCHAGAFTQVDTHKWQAVGLPFDAEAFVANKNRVVLTASHAAQVSYLSRPVSVFTYAFIEALGGKHFYLGDKNVTLFDLALYVRERSVYLSKQINKEKPQKPGLSLLEKSATENFVLSRHPKGVYEPFAFSYPFSTLTMEDGAKALLQEGMEEDKDYRQLLSQVFNIDISGNDNMLGMATGAGSAVNQNRNEFNPTFSPIINFQIPDHSKTSNPEIANEKAGSIPESLFSDTEIKALSASSKSLDEGFIHIRNNDTIYLRLPGQSEHFTYKLKSERFSSQIIPLLQRISYEDILRDPEFELLGISLFNRLFPGEDVKRAFQDFFNWIMNIPIEKLRFVFQFDKDSLETAFIPWEYLYFQPFEDQQGFFFGERFAITRRLENRMQAAVKEGILSELNILFALSPYLLDSPYAHKIPQLIENIKSDIRNKVQIKILFPENIAALEKEIKSRQYHVVHLAGVAKMESGKGTETAFLFGFLQKEKEAFSCSQWIKSDDLLSLMRESKPSFVFFHPCKVFQPELLENRNEQNFIAMTGLAFHIASLIPGALALQIGFETEYTLSFLKNFYSVSTKGVELYRAVHESLKNLTQSGLDDESLPRNRVLGMSALFSDLSGRFELINTASNINRNQNNKCPNVNDFIRAKCPEEFVLDDNGQPAGYRCPSCKKQRMFCKNEACGRLIDEFDMTEKVCSHCGKNPHENVKVAKDTMQIQNEGTTKANARPILPGGIFPKPQTESNSPLNTKLRRP
ncbi:caspase family protein [Pararhodonellum marinum]|uniref:caspase family protein n=1 Tax=Pararhodonellum marinum TaxID=2755358 RepID=UPI00188F6DBE|nr:caspase family protein [Pararhodonellum marinum]